MLKDYSIIDADSHVLEPIEMWEEYLEPRFKIFAPTQDLKIAGEKVYHKLSSQVGNQLRQDHEQQLNSHYLDFRHNFRDPSSYVRSIRDKGIDQVFLYPTHGLWFWSIDSLSPALAGALTQAYNFWLNDYCSYNPRILKGVGAINQHSPEEMVTQLRQIYEFGWKAVYLRPNPIKGRLLSDRAYEPFWTECELLDIAIGLHEASHSRLPSTGADRFSTRFSLHACSHPMEQMMALLALIEGGVLERHPGLRVGFLESGCGWLPYWLWRLDREYEEEPARLEIAENVKMKPSEYFRRQCFIAMEPYEPYLPDLIEYIGADNLIFGSDFPHPDHKPSIVADMIEQENRLSPEILQKILWDNPVRFYGLESKV